MDFKNSILVLFFSVCLFVSLYHISCALCVICHQLVCGCGDKFINDILNTNILMLGMILKQKEHMFLGSFHINSINMCQRNRRPTTTFQTLDPFSSAMSSRQNAFCLSPKKRAIFLFWKMIYRQFLKLIKFFAKIISFIQIENYYFISKIQIITDQNTFYYLSCIPCSMC